MKLQDYKNLLNGSVCKHEDYALMINATFKWGFSQYRAGARKVLKENGIDFSKLKAMGSGQFAAVWYNKESNTIIKVCQDIAYIEYAKLAMKHYKTNSLFPEVLSIKQMGEFYVIEMKKYNKVSYDSYDSNCPVTTRTYCGAWDYTKQLSCIEDWAKKISHEELKQWVTLVRRCISSIERAFLKADYIPDFGLDLHKDNIMRIKDRFVITDPICLPYVSKI